MIFAFIPAGGSLGYPELHGHGRALQQVSTARGFSYLNMVPIMERQPDYRKLYLHPLDGHMTALSHALMGEVLAGLILKGEWLKAKRPGG